MGVLVSKNGPSEHGATEAETRHFVRVAMIVSVSILVIAGAYFAALYVITH